MSHLSQSHPRSESSNLRNIVHSAQAGTRLFYYHHWCLFPLTVISANSPLKTQVALVGECFHTFAGAAVCDIILKESKFTVILVTKWVGSGISYVAGMWSLFLIKTLCLDVFSGQGSGSRTKQHINFVFWKG